MSKKENFKSDSDNIVSLVDFIYLIAKEIRLIILLPTFLCSFAIIYVLFIAEPTYKSNSKIMSGSKSTNSSQVAGLASQFGFDLPLLDIGQTTWVYPEIIKGRTILKKLLKKKFDTSEYGKQKTLLQILTYGNEEPEYGNDTLEIIAIDMLIDEIIQVDEDVKTKIFTISVEVNEPKLARDINSSLIEELDNHQRDYNNLLASNTKKFIESRIIETKKELEESEEKLKDFRGRNRRIENSPALLLEQERLAREVFVLTGVYTTLKQQLETAKIEEVKDSEYIVTLESPEIPIYKHSPQRIKIVIMTGVLGLVLGIFIAIMRYTYSLTSVTDLNRLEEIKKLVFKSIKNLLRLKFD